jgi:hypothetical protein
VIGAILGLVFSYFSGVYVSVLGTTIYLVLGFVSMIVLAWILSIYPTGLFWYSAMLFFAIFNYWYIGIRNEVVKELEEESNLLSANEYKSALKLTKNELGIEYGTITFNWLISIYIILGLGEAVISLFIEGSVLRGLGVLILIPFGLWASFGMIGIIESVLMGLFGVVKHLTDKDVREPYSRDNDSYYTKGTSVLSMINRDLDEVEEELGICNFEMVRSPIMALFKKASQDEISRNVTPNPEKFILGALSNISGDMLESGRYHIYRGALGLDGQELLKVFNFTIDKSASKGYVTEDFAEHNKELILINIGDVG